MSKKTKNVKFSFDTGLLLDGVSQEYQHMLDEGFDSEEALHHIAGDAILRYHLDKKFPKWNPSYIDVREIGSYKVELEKMESY
tara:strand:- start:490 stop:738 length:249 start_codon:yes stop_codon:yes gene_type:complete